MKSKSSLKSTIKAVAAVLCVVSACAYGANLPQVAFHVSPTGDDAADGSRERPFATVARARDAVRVLKKSGAHPGIRAASSRKRDWPARRRRNTLPLIRSQKAERT